MSPLLVKSVPILLLSPLGLIPQRGRHNRMISDYYSFFGVDTETVALAPMNYMHPVIIFPIPLKHVHRTKDEHGPVYVPKIDLSHGFNWLWLRTGDTKQSVVVMFPSG